MRSILLLNSRCLLLVPLAVLLVHAAVGQKIDVPELYNRQTLFWELGGHARGMLSANYERLFKGPFKHSLWTLRTGFGCSDKAAGQGDNDIDPFDDLIQNSILGRF